MDQDELHKRIESASLVAAELGSQRSLDSAYVAGSLTAGLGNATSDVDLFLLAPSESGFTGPTQYARDGGRVDVEWLSLAQAAGGLDALENIDLSPQKLTSIWPLFDTLDWYARFMSSVDIMNSPALHELRARAQRMRTQVGHLIITRWALGYNSGLEDFNGALMEEDFDTASYSGSTMTVAAGKAYAASLGDIYLGHKWVYKQLRRTALDFDLDTFSQYVHGSWVADGAVGARRVLTYGQTLLAAAAINQLVGAHLPAIPIEFEGSGPRRATEYVPMSMGSSVLLHHEISRQVKLTPRIALVWLWCTGADRDALIDNVMASASAIPDMELTAPEVPKIVNGLVQHGLVVAP